MLRKQTGGARQIDARSRQAKHKTPVGRQLGETETETETKTETETETKTETETET